MVCLTMLQPMLGQVTVPVACVPLILSAAGILQPPALLLQQVHSMLTSVIGLGSQASKLLILTKNCRW